MHRYSKLIVRIHYYIASSDYREPTLAHTCSTRVSKH